MTPLECPMHKYVARLTSDQSGATAVEYALLVSLIALVIVVAVAGLGLNVLGLFQRSDLDQALN
jgi:pilus assembly protein Flp/PilA